MKGVTLLYRKVHAHANGDQLVVNIPKREIAKPLGLEPGDVLQVHFDLERKQWVYRMMDDSHADQD